MSTLRFKGKEIVRNYHLSVPYHELVPDKKKSLTKKISLNDNLIIHGDNLLALKALLPTYGGRVKCVYIDPPYNTKNEKWVYNDNVNSPMMKEWLGKVVDKDDLTRHEKWLCMMMPRLKLLKDLLSEDGALIISIGDEEMYRLKSLLDEVFDEDNFIAEFVVIRAEGGGLADQYVKGHDYVLVYAKNKPNFEPLRRKKEIRGEIIEHNGKKYWLEEDWLRKEFGKYGTLLYEEIEKIKGKAKKDEIDLGLKNGEYRLVEKKKGKHIVVRLRPLDEDGSKFYSVLKHLTADGKEDLTKLGLKDVFDYPKPVALIKELILGSTFLSKTENNVILDSFAGSGTTAQAVLDLNADDGGNRRFILVQLPEEIEKDKPAYRLGFREVVDITAGRVRRVIKGVKNAKDENLRKGLDGSFSYYELGKPIDAKRILRGKDLPSFIEMARYIFYIATGKEFNEKKVNVKTGFIGESKEYKVYLLYKPDMKYLKSTALTLERAEALGKFTGKKRLMFAPAKYLDQEHLERLHIDFAQLPFEIYQKR